MDSGDYCYVSSNEVPVKSMWWAHGKRVQFYAVILGDVTISAEPISNQTHMGEPNLLATVDLWLPERISFPKKIFVQDIVGSGMIW